MNLNNTPSAGPLTAADLIPWQRTGAHAGMQPAEAATEVGADDLDAARGFVYCVPAALLAWAVIAAVSIAVKLYFF